MFGLLYTVLVREEILAQDRLIIGGASGFWGEASHATGQLLTFEGLDFLVYDYLAEITMSIMARARMKDPSLGYAVDFVTDAMAGNLAEIAAKGVRVLSNAGGVNPGACADALCKVIEKAGLDLKVAVVTGDDLIERAADFAHCKEMFDGSPFPQPNKIASINAYLGAFPIAAALDAGADIVITGRCTDSALALAAAIHHFGWIPRDVDLLAAGSLAGHLLECGPQSTGGNFTDWEKAGNLAEIGYPVAMIDPDGSFIISKPPGTSGIVSPASVGEQLLYEIGDPQAYHLPDVIADLSHVSLSQLTDNCVRISGARGRPPSGRLKVSVTFMDGFRAGLVFQFIGRNARGKAQAFVDSGLERTRRTLAAMGAAVYDDVCIEFFGGIPAGARHEEISVKAAVRHHDARAVGLFLKELVGTALATPPGLHFFTGGGRARPSPVVRLFSMLIDARDVPVAVSLNDADIGVDAVSPILVDDHAPEPPIPPEVIVAGQSLVTRDLEDLAWARSGDKGNDANIGVIARDPAYLPWIWRALDAQAIASAFAPNLKGPIQRFYLPGIHGMNIVLHAVLGGGGVMSLLNDAQGKAFAQTLLSLPVELPETLFLNTKRGES